MSLRETQPEWFGKAGIAWHGIMMIEKYVPEDDGTLDPDQYSLTFYDFLTDDKKECSWNVQSNIHAATYLHHKENPHQDRCDIEADGAGCYIEKQMRLGLPLLSSITGITFRSHATGEAQMNKSILDGQFGVAGQQVGAVVASGRQNAQSAKDVVLAHQLSGAIKNSVAREVRTFATVDKHHVYLLLLQRHNRGTLTLQWSVLQIVIDRSARQPKVKQSALAAIPVRSIAHAQFEYDDDGVWVGTRFFKHFGFGTGKYISRRGRKTNTGKTLGGLENMWENGKEPSPWTGVQIIQHHSTEKCTVTRLDGPQVRGMSFCDMFGTVCN